MIALALGYLALMFGWLAVNILSIPVFIAGYATFALVPAITLASIVLIVALACRGVDKIRGGI